MNDLQKALLEVQLKLKAPKKLRNEFANFDYRNAEGILEALKPLLKEQGLIQTVTDEVINVGNSNYIKSTVTIELGELSKSVSGLAREEESLKGQIAAQITGGASSYAKKYALNNMYNIDDSEDPDSRDNTKVTKSAPKKETKETELATAKQRKFISDCLEPFGVSTPADIKSYLADNYGITGLLSKADAGMVIDDLTKNGAFNEN